MGLNSSDQRENLTGPRDVWIWALSWFSKPPSDAAKRSKQAALIQAIKDQLAHEGSVEEIGAVWRRIGGLHDLYCQDSRWCLQLARQMFPREWPQMGVHACTAAAYGLRYVEMMTGKRLDAREPMPRYIGEWAVW